MNAKSTVDLSWDEFDELRDPRPAENDFDRVVDSALSRRGFLGGVLAAGSGAMAFGSGILGAAPARAQTAFAFDPIGIATDFAIHEPAGYQWKPLVRWGDALFSDASDAFSPETGVPVELSDRVFGENTDGMELFVIDGRQVIAVNSE